MRTPTGGAMIPATMTRSGVFSYTLSDGTTRKELRPADEVLSPRAIASLETAVVTVGHPGMVTPDAWRSMAVGEVRQAKSDGTKADGLILVRDADTLKRIDAGDLVEVSCGYDADYDPTPGTYNGQAYDGIQRNVVYNHVGLGPAGWGRLGSTVKLHLDAGVCVLNEAGAYTRDMADEVKSDLLARLDGLTADIARYTKEKKELTERVDGLKLELNTARTQIDRVTAERDELKTRLDAATKQVANIDSLVEARATAIENAALVAGKRLDSKGSVRDIQVRALTARDAKFDASGKSDDYIAARFDMAVEQARAAGKSVANVAQSVTSQHEDGLDAFEKAQAESRKYWANRFNSSFGGK